MALHLSFRSDYSEAVTIHQRPNQRLKKLRVLGGTFDRLVI